MPTYSRAIAKDARDTAEERPDLSISSIFSAGEQRKRVVGGEEGRGSRGRGFVIHSNVLERERAS